MSDSVLLPEAADRAGLLQHASHLVNDLFENLPDWPVLAGASSAAIRERLSHVDFAAPIPESQVLDQVHAMLRDWGLQVAHPRYFGLFNPTPSFMAVLADLLVAAFNPQLGAWHHSPVGVEIERHLINYFASRFGLPDSAFGHFTSGGSEANMTGLLVALTRRYPALGEAGLRALERQPVFFASEESHHSLEKVAHLCGLGRRAMIRVAVGADGGMDPAALAAAIDHAAAAGSDPFLVVGTAGTTNAGLVDPLPALADVCRAHRLHLHVDAAWGGGVVLSDRLSPLLEGIGRADSITFDPHKLLSVPMAAGMILCADGGALERVFHLDPSYVPKSDTEGLDNYKQSAQFSRRFIGLKLFMSLAAVGRSGYAATIERQVELGQGLAELLRDAGWTVVNDARLALVCFENPAWDGLPRDRRAELNERVARHVVDSGQAWISTTRIVGRPVLRACITSYRTQHDDLIELTRLLAAARTAAGAVSNPHLA